MNIRILLVDDHEMVRRGLRTLFDAEEDLEVVGEAASCAAAVERVRLDRPHVVILDVQLPDGSGAELCAELTAIDPAVRCLMFTSFEDVEARATALAAGAAGFLLKQIRVKQVVDAVRAVGRGARVVAPPNGADAPPATPTRQPSLLDTLTPQERRVLDLVVEGKTNRAIAAELGLTEKTVKNYMSGVLMKLGVAHRAEAAVFVVRERQGDLT